jgi:urea transport system substrate-binding protein
MFGQTDWRDVVTDIRTFARAPEAATIMSTVSGDADLHFYRMLALRVSARDNIPDVAHHRQGRVGRFELPTLMRSNLAGHWVA